MGHSYANLWEFTGKNNNFIIISYLMRQANVSGSLMHVKPKPQETYQVFYSFE